LKNFRHSLRKELEDAGFLERFNVMDVQLVSAKTGYGVEDLISVSFALLSGLISRFSQSI
jgi:hypothetical protein